MLMRSNSWNQNWELRFWHFHVTALLRLFWIRQNSKKYNPQKAGWDYHWWQLILDATNLQMPSSAPTDSPHPAPKWCRYPAKITNG